MNFVDDSNLSHVKAVGNAGQTYFIVSVSLLVLHPCKVPGMGLTTVVRQGRKVREVNKKVSIE